MFSVCVCVFLCLCTGRGLATSWSPVQGVLPTFPDQETEETQPYAPKAGAMRKKKKLCYHLQPPPPNWMKNSAERPQSRTKPPFTWNIERSSSLNVHAQISDSFLSSRTCMLISIEKDSQIGDAVDMNVNFSFSLWLYFV
jgi:hypothetical protein